MRIVSRAEWGAQSRRGSPTVVPKSARTDFVVHYEDDRPVSVPSTCQGCPAQIRDIQKFHMNGRGWADIGYSFVICQHGTIFEGRGWDVQGAHANDGNRPGIGVQIHIGGDQTPSREALSAARWLYDRACARFGRALRKRTHSDWVDTSCPGKQLTKWVRAGMPVGQIKEDFMAQMTDNQVARLNAAVDRVLGFLQQRYEGGDKRKPARALDSLDGDYILQRIDKARDQLAGFVRDSVAAAVAQIGTQSGQVDVDQLAGRITKALNEKFVSGIASDVAAQLEVSVRDQADA